MKQFDLSNWKSIISTMKAKQRLGLNPKNYPLSIKAEQRLKWMYIIYNETKGDVTKAANKIGVSRQWLSAIKNNFERHKKDPRSLEPESRAPHNTDNHPRISRDIVRLIKDIRKKHKTYGKLKIQTVLKRDYQITIGLSTVNRYLHKEHLINPKLSAIIVKAFQNKKEKEENKEILKNIRCRSPLKLNDYKPGAKVEKDMKILPIPGREHKTKKDYWFQQTFVDTFTRKRAMELTKDYESKTIAKILEPALKRINKKTATMNTDGGPENHGEVDKKLKELGIIHFESRPGTPTDDPRVESSHKTDEFEFYGQGNMHRNFKKQQKALAKWEWEYNNYRPHQALGNLTPVEFEQLYKRDPEAAYRIVESWRAYLNKNRLRLKKSRQLKGREQVDELMRFVDAKLQENTVQNTFSLPKYLCQWC